MKFNLHGGHGASGGQGCGAVGFLDESAEARKVKDRVIELLRNAGHTAFDCTYEGNASQSTILKGIVSKCNAHKVDLDVSIHLNAGKASGVEVLNYSEKTKVYSDKICANISSALGIRNRGTKYSQTLYVLRNTNSPAILIECAFVDNETDFKAWNVDKVARAIVKAITGQAVADKTPTPAPQPTPAPTPSVDPTKELIKAGQIHANNFCGVGLVPDGIVGTNTKKAKAKVLQHAMNLDYKSGLAEDGIAGTNTKKALGSHYVKKGEKQYMVTAAEILMYLNGCNPGSVECPGIYGNGLTNAAKTKFGGDGQKISASNFLTLIQ